jgi:Uma2 family endonuclease
MTAAQKLTVQDAFLALPATEVGQIVDGELYVQPRPRAAHARATAKLGARLDQRFDGGSPPGGWILLDEPELHLGADILVPDLAGWRRERLPEMPASGYFAVAPDWICEVLSPSTARLDRGKKLSAYGREGVPFVWLIDPDAQTLEVLTRGEDGRYTIAAVHSGDDVAFAVPFEVFGLELRALWTW